MSEERESSHAMHVRSGSKAAARIGGSGVCFSPESGHGEGHPHLSSRRHVVEPIAKSVQRLAEYLPVVPAGSSRHMKRMIGVRKHFERCKATKLFANRPQLVERSQRIAG